MSFRFQLDHYIEGYEYDHVSKIKLFRVCESTEPISIQDFKTQVALNSGLFYNVDYYLMLNETKIEDENFMLADNS